MAGDEASIGLRKSLERVLLRWSPAQELGELRFLLLFFGVACQLATVWITWPLWQTRTTVPHLPAIDLPQVSFGWLMVLSAGAIVVRPSWGLAAHWIVLVTASAFDQYRLQPQFFLIALLMTTCVSRHARILARWILASTWLWAGLHKLLSPDWFGHASHWLVVRSGLDADTWYLLLAWLVGISEVLLGIVACVRPKLAAVVCAPLHIGIVAFLLMIDWNMSVIPWNLSMGLIGCWVMWSAGGEQITRRVERVIGIVCLVMPLGFYVGWVDHGFSGVLYSDWLPRGQITSQSGHYEIRGWGDLAVPFPSERRLLRIYFERAAQAGDKLHVSDPRRLLDDQYFVLDASGQAQSIDLDTFLLPQSRIPGPLGEGRPTVSGIGIEEKRTVFSLSRAGVRMVRAKSDQPIFAVEFTPENFDPRLLVELQGLPNLLQVQLAGTSVQDRDLAALLPLRLLTGIGLDRTSITDTGIRKLGDLPFLQHIECEHTAITDDALDSVLK